MNGQGAKDSGFTATWPTLLYSMKAATDHKLTTGCDRAPYNCIHKMGGVLVLARGLQHADPIIENKK